MTKATEFMNQLIATAIKQKNEKKTCYGFGHGEFNGHNVMVRLMDVRTNSKTQTNRNWKVDGKVVSAAKVAAVIEA